MSFLRELERESWLQALYLFTFYYPVIMAHVWTAGAVVFYFAIERTSSLRRFNRVARVDWPMVSIIVPCYNEEDNVDEVISHLLSMDYPNYEIIAVNDGSKDRTGELLDQLAQKDQRVRVIHQAKNQGKAVGLITAATVARSEYLVCIDGDALLDHGAIPWLIRHFATNPNVAAVTGNPRIRTRSTMLGRLQVGEFSSIIGLIKRAQSTYGRLYSVSGVIVAFRRSALHDVGYWSADMMCEDIDITWKLQTKGWTVHYEPHALCWILMPETIVGLWKQRLRWAMGGIQVLFRYSRTVFTRRGAAMLPLFIEYLLSVLWSYAMALCLAIALIRIVERALDGDPIQALTSGLMPGWSGLWLATVCLLQMLISLLMERRYEKGLLGIYSTVIWYPIAFWLLSMSTTVRAVPKVLWRKKGQRARWVSPDRGHTQQNPPQ
jgi:poly-beta-1,6-N-acetyl-D-glucosamine synthase